VRASLRHRIPILMQKTGQSLARDLLPCNH
jgi:hypothetical protein